MKQVVMFIGFILLGHISFSQKSPRFIAQDDPMVGDWKFNADSSKHTQKAPIVSGEEYLQLLPGMEVGMVAKTVPVNNNYIRASYFVATKDAKKLHFSISESYLTSWAGKDVSLNYEYHQASDMLVLIIGTKKYYYSRIK